MGKELSATFRTVRSSLLLLVFGLAPLLFSAGMTQATSHGEETGEEIFMRSCVACHGTDGAGTMPGIPGLSGQGGPMEKTDAALMRSILEGVDSGNTPTPMPPRGGDETLSENGARLVLDFLRRRFGPRSNANP
jgi:mono/diheme cytochrome c family protein